MLVLIYYHRVGEAALLHELRSRLRIINDIHA